MNSNTTMRYSSLQFVGGLCIATTLDGVLAFSGIRRFSSARLQLQPTSRNTIQYANTKGVDISKVEDVEITEEELEFFALTKQLCGERNLPFEKIKNARDLASCQGSPIKPNRILRMGRVSDATKTDLDVLFGELQIKTLVDLRSPTELKDDPTLERQEVFGDFVSVVWTETSKGGKVKALPLGTPRIRKLPAWKRLLFRKKEKFDALEAEQVDLLEEDEDDELPGIEFTSDENRKERHFVSLMNEFKYVRGTLAKLKKRDIARVILKSPGALVSRRVRTSCKGVFLSEINDGGLPMLNELLLRFGAPGIKYVLDLMADRTRHPIAFHCTAGKDRTGAITAIILSLLGVSDESIVEDYSLSANVYAEMNDHKAMVGALSQRSLDPKTFLGAPPEVMRDILNDIRDDYGSVEGYLDFIGFGPESRKQLVAALTDP